jgi:multidrug efflux pump subunit AcrA (membrane-fusion protein)
LNRPTLDPESRASHPRGVAASPCRAGFVVRRRAAALLGIVLLAAGCGPAEIEADVGALESSRATSAGGRAKALTLVELTTFRRGDIRTKFDYQVDIESELRVDVFPKVGPAYIDKVLVEEGDPVTEGQPLLELVAIDFELEVRRRDALWRSRQQSELQADQMLREAGARYRAQVALAHKAELDYERAKNAQSGGIDVLSVQELDAAKAEFDRSQAESEALALAIERGSTELELARLATELARVELDSAKKDLVDTVVRSPIDGVVQRRDVNPGLLVNSGTHRFTLVDPTKLRAFLSVPQEELALAGRVGLEVDFYPVSFPDRVFKGYIASVNPAVDPESGQVRLRALFDEGAVGVVRPGMFAKAFVVVAQNDDAVLLNKRAIVYERGQQWFFAMEDGVARKHEFVAGDDTVDEVEVLSVDGGPPDLAMQIIVVGQDRLRDGDPVQVVTPEQS